MCVCACVCITHSTGGVDSGPLHGDGDAVEKDDDQNHMVKHLVSNDLIACYTKPARYNQNHHSDAMEDTILVLKTSSFHTFNSNSTSTTKSCFKKVFPRTRTIGLMNK